VQRTAGTHAGLPLDMTQRHTVDQQQHRPSAAGQSRRNPRGSKQLLQVGLLLGKQSKRLCGGSS
jgi:hypothetical protein